MSHGQRNPEKFSRPADTYRTVTPSNSTELELGSVAGKWPRALYIGTAGNLAVRGLDGTEVTFTNVPVGVFPIRCSRVLSTGTTASGIIALY